MKSFAVTTNSANIIRKAQNKKNAFKVFTQVDKLNIKMSDVYLYPGNNSHQASVESCYPGLF